MNKIVSNDWLLLINWTYEKEVDGNIIGIKHIKWQYNKYLTQ